MPSLSALQRAQLVDKSTHDNFDLIIIGGGITGAGILLDAATRGLKALLVEQEDFAWGTSSRSTKLIHGGLRYLKQMEFGLVREVGKERAVLYKNARHLVRPSPMLLPVIKNGSLDKWTSSAALWLYDRLARVDKNERRQMLNRKETLSKEPLLNKDLVTAGGYYYEYRSDDARLTISILKKAASLGAVALNYCRVDSFTEENSKITGLVFTDRIRNKKLKAQASVIVNAAGPWVDQLRTKTAGDKSGKHLFLSKGIHLVFDRKRFPVRQAIYFDVPTDNRMIFVVPRDNKVYLGTTDTAYQGDIGFPNITATDVDYLLTAANHMMPSLQLTRTDVESSWSGLRPLIHEQGKDPGEISRKDEIFISTSGLISIAGGKLTGYRKMAERIIEHVYRYLPSQKNHVPCKTEEIALAGGEFLSEKELHQFISDNRKHFKFDNQLVDELVFRYGTDAAVIFEHALNKNGTKEDLIQSEWTYAVEEEMCYYPSDFLIRRSGKLYFDRPALSNIFPNLFNYMKKYLQWTDSQEIYARKSYEQAYHDSLDF